MTTVTKYGLWHIKKKKLLNYMTDSNRDGDFCCDTQFILTEYENDLPWLVDTAYNAEYVRNFSTEWYNADFETPTHHFDPEELKVVKVTISTDVEDEEITVPSMEEYLEIMYKDKNPDHYEMCMKNLDRTMKYSRYDLDEMIRQGKWPRKEDINE